MLGVWVLIFHRPPLNASVNARQNDLNERASFITAFWGQAISGAFDLIVSNPPYIVPHDVATLDPEVRFRSVVGPCWR